MTKYAESKILRSALTAAGMTCLQLYTEPRKDGTIRCKAHAPYRVTSNAIQGPTDTDVDAIKAALPKGWTVELNLNNRLPAIHLVQE